jgi:hypothetical protein
VAPLIRAGSADDKETVARLLRNGLFPLIVIVLLVYLVSQTLLTEDGGGGKAMS